MQRRGRVRSIVRASDTSCTKPSEEEATAFPVTDEETGTEM